jgi:RNase adaptor protein for sRNA GlmZ degradation
VGTGFSRRFFTADPFLDDLMMREKKGSVSIRRCLLLGGMLVSLLVVPPAFAKRAPKDDNADAARTAPAVRNTVEELRQLMDSQQLTELRTTYNGSYGASLLFNTATLQYYVSLFHEKEFWRVIKTDSVENAEKVYRTFVGQTEQLAQVYIDTTRLEAGKRYTENLVAYNEQRLRSLQQEADLQRQQAQQVSSSIQQAKQQAVSLSTDLRSSHTQLDQLNQRIQALQAQQGNPELSLPVPESSTPQPTPPSPAGHAGTP